MFCMALKKILGLRCLVKRAPGPYMTILRQDLISPHTFTLWPIVRT